MTRNLLTVTRPAHNVNVWPVCMYVCMYVRMSIMTAIALLVIPGSRDPPACVPPLDFFLANEGSSFLPSWELGSGGVIHIRPVRPFETVPMIKGDTNNIEFNRTLHIDLREIYFGNNRAGLSWLPSGSREDGSCEIRSKCRLPSAICRPICHCATNGSFPCEREAQLALEKSRLSCRR